MEKPTMKTVVLSVVSLGEAKRRVAAAFRGKAQGAHISFTSIELLWKILAPKRWQLLKAMTGQGPMSIREAARRVDRDVKAVHGDVRALLQAGILDRTDEGHVVFPYDAVRVDFTVRAA
jgi:predicted transcriptional regulator